MAKWSGSLEKVDEYRWRIPMPNGDANGNEKEVSHGDLHYSKPGFPRGTTRA